MNYADLKAKIESTPECDGKSPEEIAAIINALGTGLYAETWATERTIIAAFGLNARGGDAFLNKLAAVGNADTLIARAVNWIKPEQQGVDLGHASTRGLLQSLVGTAGITQDEVNTVIAVAPEKKWVVETLGVPYVTANDILAAEGI